MNLKRDIREEIANFDLRYSAARLIISCIPPLVANRLRTRVLRAAGIQIGWATTVGGALSVHGDGRPVARLRIGSNCWINAGCVFDASSSIDIGNSVALGQGVMILTNSHEIGPSRERAGTKTSLPVVIGDGVWIGARATVLPGVTIGSGAIVAAGALVNSSVEPDSLVGGVPARLIRKLDRR